MINFSDKAREIITFRVLLLLRLRKAVLIRENFVDEASVAMSRLQSLRKGEAILEDSNQKGGENVFQGSNSICLEGLEICEGAIVSFCD